jgi:LemA protein
MEILWIALPILALAAGIVYTVKLYNELVHIAVSTQKSWANISVLEKQRYEEVPRLVEICNAYMKYESETLVKVTQARASFLEARTPSATAKADLQLEGALKTLFATVENYPELKAEENFRRLQGRITALENAIADRREFYNDSVAIFNTRIRQVPYTFLADALGYAEQDMYEVPEEETKPVAVKFGAAK